jgi:hypothetical protein
MHPIASVLDACCQPVHGVMPPPLVTIVGPQFPVRPLFVEEMTKAILESGYLKAVDGHYELTVVF